MSSKTIYYKYGFGAEPTEVKQSEAQKSVSSFSNAPMDSKQIVRTMAQFCCEPNY